MAKLKTVYVCAQCGHESGKWLGKCPNCESWNSFSEEVTAPKSAAPVKTARPGQAAQKLHAVAENEQAERLLTGYTEFDRVLGGGLVRGSAVLLGGDPGIGKSTLLLQMSGAVSQRADPLRVLYASGEESAAQIKMRAKRLGIAPGEIYLLCETDLSILEGQIDALSPDIVIVDSVQTLRSDDSPGAPGSVSQVRDATAALTRIAKTNGASVFIVGHVTKQGAIAGPRVLEHLVDTVLYFEGDRHDSYRILRAVKNRFGSTNEIGVFEMAESGMCEVPNPSSLFLSHREHPMPGCALLCTLEGTRPVVAEVQALCCPTAFGTPRRTSAGIDYNRMALLCAVLEKKLGLRLSDQDIYVNIVGGLRVDERSADLAVVAAIASSLSERPIRPGFVAVGEVGLTAEVRGVVQAEKRAQECARLGFDALVLPKAKASELHIPNLQVAGVGNVAEALERLLL